MCTTLKLPTYTLKIPHKTGVMKIHSFEEEIRLLKGIKFGPKQDQVFSITRVHQIEEEKKNLLAMQVITDTFCYSCGTLYYIWKFICFWVNTVIAVVHINLIIIINN